jgi:hypothetical protein
MLQAMGHWNAHVIQQGVIEATVTPRSGTRGLFQQ